MGLLNELNTINRTLENNQKQNTKTEQKELQQLRKQKILILLKQKVNELLKEANNGEELESIVTSLIQHKEDNIRILQEIYFEKYDVKLNKIELNYIDSNYLSTIQKIKKEYTLIFKQDLIKQKEEAKEQKALYQEQLRREREEAIARQEAYSTIITSLKYILLIVCAPFVLLFAFVFGMLKSVK